MPRSPRTTPPPIRSTPGLPGTTPPPPPAEAPRRRGRKKKQAEIVCIFGRRGSGKTTRVMELLEEHPRVVIVDPLGEYDGTVFTVPVALYRFLRDNPPPRFRAVFRPGGSTACPIDPTTQFPWICKIAETVGDLCLVCEEVHLFAPAARIDPQFYRLVTLGRHRNVSMLCVSQRPATVNRTLTSQAARIIVYRFHEPRDVKYFRDIIGLDADRIPTLPDFQPLEIAL